MIFINTLAFSYGTSAHNARGQKMANVLIGAFLLIFLSVPFKSQAQYAIKHYVAPAPWNYSTSANEFVVAAGVSGTAVVTITKSDGTAITTLNVTYGSPVAYRPTGTVAGTPANSVNVVYNDAGLIFTSTLPISVSVRNIESDQVNGGNSAETKGNASLSSYGNEGSGNLFRVGYYRSDYSGLASISGSANAPVYSVLAIEDGTNVSVNGVPLITLNAGQSYLFQTTLGSLVSAAKPVVMNAGSWTDGPGGCGDAVFNQIPPVRVLGNDYIVVRGTGTGGTQTYYPEQTTFVATENNTSVTVKNYYDTGVEISSTTYTLASAGDYQTFFHGDANNPYSSSSISSNKKIAVFSGTAEGCEVDMAILPPLTPCSGSFRVETKKFTTYLGGDLPYFGYVLLQSSSAIVNLNGTNLESLSGVRRQIGTTGFYLIDFTNTQVSNPTDLVFESTARMTLGMVQQGGGFSMSSYLSSFNDTPLPPTATTNGSGCVTLLTAQAGFAPYQWYFNDVLISGATNQTYTPTALGAYTVSGTRSCGVTAPSTSFVVNCVPIDTDNDGITDDIDIDDDNDGIPDCVENQLSASNSITDFMELNNSATQVSATELNLTPDLGSQGGQAWFYGKIDFSTSFSFSYEAFLGNKDVLGADGIATVFHNSPAGVNAFGVAGAGIGALNIANGLVLELDTYDNGVGENDIPADHGAIWDSDVYLSSLSPAISLGELENNAWHTVSTSWNVSTQTLSYTVDGILAGTYTGDVVTNFFAGESKVYYGYTASTGGLMNRQSIRFPNLCDLAFQLDTDNDGIPNSLDLDSDGDGCSDAFEAGATTSTTANFQFPTAGVGTNGLANSLETVADNGTINYTLTYNKAIDAICCIVPSAITLTQTAPTCTGATANNNGKITLSASTNGTHYGISTLGAATYDGATTIATATAIVGTPDVQTAIPNTGGSYIVRIFNGADACYTDQTVTVAAVTCAPAVCAITLTPSVSGCYQSGGASKATVSVEVSWENATVSPTANDASDAITVTFGGQTKTINPGAYTSSGGNGTIVSPQVVAFEVNADASTQTIQAFFGADYASSTCKDEETGVVLPAACPPSVCTGAELGGKAYADYNADGIKQSGETNGVAGITVTVYDCAGNSQTTTTDANGNWRITTALTYPVRVEFSAIPTLYGQGTLNGTDGRTTTQFIASADCNVDLGVLDPTDYCQSNPKVIVPCYINGDPNDPSGANDVAIVSLDYALSPSSKTGIAKIPDVAAVWGTAYAKRDNSVYTAAVLRRHAGLTNAGLGGIFKTDLATNTTTLFVDVETLGVNLGSIGSNAARGLGSKTAPNQDEEAYAKVGKTGMGDLDISGDGNTLYFVNLFEKKLHSLSTTSPTAAPGVAIPNPGCASGDYRPWGLKIYKGFVYVGVVCDASTGSKSELRAYIYQYNISTGTFNTTPVLDFPLTYPKGFPWGGDPSITGWFPWSDNINDAIALQTPFARTCCASSYGDVLMYPQPILSDIEFDVDGSMVLGFGDRFSFQTGNKNFAPNGSATYGLMGSSNNGYSGLVGGDILRAYSNGTTFVLENNAKAGPSVGAGSANNQGPGFGEFYNDNFFFNGGLSHAENANGGLALRPGSGETIYVAMDPEDGVGTSGGLRKVSNISGQPTGAITIITGYLEVGLFAKAASLGDLEITCATPTYLEIGNRVWLDTNKDGVQDPCEKGLKNVAVALYKGTTKIAQTTTDANGEYYFSSAYKIGAGWIGTGADTTLLPNTAYKLVFGEGQLSGTNLNVGNSLLTLTAQDATANNGNDQNDSDAGLVSGAFCINLTTGGAGSVNHTLDAGFYCTNPPLSNIAQTAPTCTGATATNDGKISLTAASAPYDKFRVKTGTGAWTGDTTYATATAIAAPMDLQSAIPNAGATYTIRFYAGECCYKDTAIVVAAVTCLASCSITATLMQNPCNNNGTTAITTDDYFTITVSAVLATNGGASGKYEVVLNGTVLNTGGTTYGTPVTVGTATTFTSNGATTYQLTVRDLDMPTCTTTVFTTTASAACSTIPCPPQICLPVTVTRN
jgi:trimeric autotransporter adhesin